ncbi:hypothetical protein GCM10023331_07000 [Algivirga pacifica]|uniref:Erythromycin esterase homolog n=2 Tax=Algivirga pacifica TaxID=1162670 RepID=A0ABP9D7H2_9BACT
MQREFEQRFLEDVGDARVVFLGEIMHSEGNIFEHKQKLIELLYQEKGFNKIAFESSFYAFNRKAEHDSLYRNYLNRAIFPIWTQAKEFQPTLSWLETHRDVNVTGFDAQMTSGTPSDYLTERWKGYIPQQQEISWEQVGEIISQLDDLSVGYYSKTIDYFSKEKRKTFEQLYEATMTLSDQGEEAYVKQEILSAKAMFDWYRTEKIYLKNAETWIAKDGNGRDLQMAKNLLFYLEQNPDAKVICWGASGHFAKGFQAVKQEELNAFIPMGETVVKALGAEAVRSYAYTTGKGEYKRWFEMYSEEVPTPPSNSLEGRLLSEGTSTTFIPLKDSVFVSTNMEFTPVEGNWSEVFDGMVYMDSIIGATSKSGVDETSDSIPKTTVSYHLKEEASMQYKRKFTQVKSREGVTYKGQVQNTTTKEPIPFALIKLQGTDQGTVCDAEGKFTITAKTTDSIEVSSASYETGVFGLKKTDSLVLKLQEKVLEMEALTIRSKPMTPKQLLKRYHKSRKKNHYAEPHNVDYHYRFRLFEEDSLMGDHEYVLTRYVDRKLIERNEPEILKEQRIHKALVVEDSTKLFNYLVYGHWSRSKGLYNPAFGWHSVLSKIFVKSYDYEVETGVGKDSPYYILHFHSNRNLDEAGIQRDSSEYFGKAYLCKETLALKRYTTVLYKVLLDGRKLFTALDYYYQKNEHGKHIMTHYTVSMQYGKYQLEGKYQLLSQNIEEVQRIDKDNCSPNSYLLLRKLDSVPYREAFWEAFDGDYHSRVGN